MVSRPRAGFFFQLRPFAALMAAAGTCTPLTAWAQPATTPSTTTGINPAAIDGRTFAGVRFNQAAVTGKLKFAASRVWQWDDGATQRLVLDGDVRVTIAGYAFRAKRAAAWLETFIQDQKQHTQVFVYFEELGSAADPAGGVTMTSDNLPVRAVIDVDGEVSLTADRLEQGPPPRAAAPVLPAAEAALRKSLRREMGSPEEPPPETPLPTLSRKSAAVRPPRPPLLPEGAITMTPLPQPSAVDTSQTSSVPGRRTTTPPRAAEAPTARPATPPSRGPVAVTPRPVPPSTTPGQTQPAAPPGTPPTGEPGTPTPAQPTTTAVAPVVPVAPDATQPGTPSLTPLAPAAAARSGENQPIFSKDGIVTLAPGEVSIVSGETENTIIATSGVSVQYEDFKAKRVLTMTAQRAVVFTDPGKLESAFRVGAGAVRGVFLEGNVTASDGTFTMRAPQIYYDFRENKAIAIDAVFWTYDQTRRLPLYVRAKSIRQESARQFVAKDARFTNTPFFDPELAIGASTVTITKQDDATVTPPPAVGEPGAAAQDDGEGDDSSPLPGEGRTIVDARNITLQLLGLPVFYWPRYSGDPATFPIKDFRIESRTGSGVAVRATLNAYSLLGLKRPRDLTADVITDYYFQRGVGLGGRVAWENANHEGDIFGYMLPDDRGTDITKPGARVSHDGEFRGLLAFQERWKISREWTLFAEAATVSDPTFVSQFFQPIAENGRELTDRLLARRIEDNTYFSFQVKGTTDDFISNEYLLQSQGYSTTKLPEAFYAREADDVLPEYAPGLLTYTSEYRVGRVGMAFDEVLAGERGFTSNTTAQRAFGINFNQSIAQSLRDQGLFEEGVNRADTRHELSMQTTLGPLRIQPFVVGRGTFWDNDFAELSPENDDNARFWSAAGVRVGATVQHVYEDVDSRLLDIHRIRHIVEPNATVWVSGTSVEADDLPIYDYDVEPLTDGGMARVGVTQTFQTQRGGPGQWHSVDLLTLSTDFVYSTDDTPRRYAIPRFVDFRPELSSAGKFGVVDATLRLTDATSLAGGVVYDLDAHQQATSNIGLLLRHMPGFVSLIDLRYINAQDSTYLTYATTYELTDKYAATVGLTYDTTNGGFQSTVAEVRRRFTSMLLGVSISYNEISGESSFGFVFQPFGAAGSGRLSGSGNGGAGGGTGGFTR